MDRLEVNGFDLDLPEGKPIPLTLSIADYKQPEKRKRSFSTEVDLPGTQSNCNFFREAYGYHSTGEYVYFNSVQKNECTYYKRNVPVMPNAVMQLKSVTIINKRPSFKIQIYSEFVDIFLLLSNIDVQELDWSEYDHVLNRANIIASWSTLSGVGYRYPLIERGNGRAGTLIWNTTDIVPYVHMREVVQKMLDYIDVRFDSTFLDTSRAKNTLYGYGGGDYVANSITPQDVSDRLVDYDNGVLALSLTSNAYFPLIPTGGTSTTGTISTFGLFQFNDLNFSTSLVQDELMQYDNGVITIQRSGNYKLSITGSLDFQYDTGSMSFSGTIFGSFYVSRNGYFLANIPITSQSASFQADLALTQQLTLQSGDEISFLIKAPGCTVVRTNGAEPVDLTIGVDVPLTFTIESTDTAVTDGSTVSLSRFIPSMKCSDFLLGVFRQYYMYMSDPDIYGESQFDTLEDFYQPTNVFDDVSTLIANGKPFILKPSANEYAKNILFKWKESKDYDAVQYAEKWGEQYGDLTVTNPSYYAKGEQKFELPWSTIVPYEISAGILVPRFITLDGDTVKPIKGAPRLVMWNGLKDGAWVFRNTDDPSQQQNLTQYPCIHHFDDWEDPGFDLNFKLVNELFYVASVVTTINCYSEYYARFINEFISVHGKILECSLYWTEQDVKRRDFSKLLMINGMLFRLNIISEFDPDFADTTDIELIRVLEANRPARIQIPFADAVPVVFDSLISSPEGVGDDTGVINGGHNTVLINSGKK